MVNREATFVMGLARGDNAFGLDLQRGQPDAHALCELATQHQVDALCWWTQREARDQSPAGLPLPQTARDRLRAQYSYHLLRNESLLNDLEAVGASLTAKGLDALFLKGPWLMLRAYPDPGTRPVHDIDLCVREEHYTAVVAALREVAYQPSESLPSTSGAALRRAHYGRQLRFQARGRRPLELHFRLVNVGPPDDEHEWVWTTARTLSLGRCSIAVPGPEAMLLHLLLHAGQHGFTVLRLLHDIRWALQRDARILDEVILLREIRRLRCRAVAYYALLLARDLAGAKTEGMDLEALRPSWLRRSLYEWAWNVAAARRLEAPRPATEVEAPKLYLLEMGRGRDKARYMAGLIREAGGLLPFIQESRRVLIQGASE